MESTMRKEFKIGLFLLLSTILCIKVLASNAKSIPIEDLEASLKNVFYMNTPLPPKVTKKELREAKEKFSRLIPQKLCFNRTSKISSRYT